jgi:ribosomal protein S11
MPTLEEISAKVDELQVALDNEQEQVAALIAAKDAAISALTESITALEALVAEGGTAEARQAVIDSLDAIKADLEATV